MTVYCIKKNKTIPDIQNARYYLKHYKEKNRKKLEARIEKEFAANIEKCKKLSKDFEPVITSLKLKFGSSICETGGCIFRKVISADYSTILAIQDKVVADLLENKTLFIPTEKHKIKQYIEDENTYFICVETTSGIGAYAYTLLNDNTSYITEHFKNKKVALFDSVVVLPELRGNQLQQRFMELSFQKAKETNHDVIAAIVSPENAQSLNNFEKNGFKKLKTIEVGGFTRYIVFKNLSND